MGIENTDENQLPEDLSQTKEELAQNLRESTRPVTLDEISEILKRARSDYCRYHKLQHGDEVIVLYDNLILIIPKGEQDSISKEKVELIDRLLR